MTKPSIIHYAIGHFEGSEETGTPIKWIDEGTLCKADDVTCRSHDIAIVDCKECIKKYYDERK